MNEDKQFFDEKSQDAVVEAIQKVQQDNKVQLGEPAIIALSLFGKMVTDILWNKLQ